MNISPTLFKAYDIRGLVGSELTPEVAQGVGRALADWLPRTGPVAVGYDMRPDSAELAAAVKAGLLQQGRDVVDIGQVSTDMIYFAVGFYGLAGGAMVTASHNPGQYNGIKLCREGAGPISIETGLAEIRDCVASDKYKTVSHVGGVEQKLVTDDWLRHALSFIEPDKLKPFHIAIDAGNGMAGAIVPHLEGKWPLKVEPMYFELDGTFPNHPANPLDPANLEDLIARIKSENLDFGIAFDGDGDRAFLVDDRGRIVPGSIMTAMLAEYFLEQNPGATILHNVICSRIVPETISAKGGTAVRTKVGHSFIKADMRRYDAPFAGEHSGHFYFRNNWSADSGLIAAIVATQILSKSGRKLSELVDAYAKYTQSGEINSEVNDKAAKLRELAGQYADGKQDELDGLTVNYADWWFNVRPSNTEPFLRLNVEAITPELMKEKTSELLALIRA